MELTPNHFTLSLNSADRVWQMEGQCKPFLPSNRVVGVYPDPSGAQIVDLAPYLFEISLSETNRARDLNSRGFAPSLMLLEYLQGIIKGKKVFNAALARTDPLIFLKGNELGDKAYLLYQLLFGTNPLSKKRARIEGTIHPRHPLLGMVSVMVYPQ